MQEKSLIKKKILEYLEFKDVSKYQFYKETNITRGILDQNNGITEENIYRFLAYAKDISLTWLFTGHGDMLNTDTQIKINQTIIDKPIYNELLADRDKRIEEKERDIKELNREIGKLQHQIEILKKENPSSAYRIAAESELIYKDKRTK